MELTSEQIYLRQDRGAMISALGVQVKGKACKCPFHDDRHASASVFTDEQGTIRFKCHTCDWSGDVFDVRARIEGRSLGDVLKEGRLDPKPTLYPSLDSIIKTYSNVERVYKYTNPETKLVELAVIRYQPNGHKQFAQCSPRGDAWVKSRPESKLPLYNRSRIAKENSVIVVEGEKAVHALFDIGIQATTSPMGAGKASLTDWTPLKGKVVYLWPDNDSKGIEHMEAVRGLLDSDCELFWIEPLNLGIPLKGDVVEFLADNAGTPEDQRTAIQLVLDEARPLGAAQELGRRFDSIIAGDWVNIEWPWGLTSAESQSLLPDTVTAMCGDPGSGKSFLLLEAFWKWHLSGRKVALFELEDDRVYHLQRVLAQLESNAWLTDAEWVRNNPDKAKASYEAQKDILGSLGKVMWDAPDRQVTLTELADWFEARCEEGYEICVIDPVTAAAANDKPWIEDQNFIFRVKTTAKKYHSRLIYAIHPRISQGKVGASLSRLAGGAAYPRFSHSVFWLTKHDKPKTATVWQEMGGKRQVTFDRTLRIAKARNGRGAGSEMAFHLNTDSLCFLEYGSIVSETVEVLQ